MAEDRRVEGAVNRGEAFEIQVDGQPVRAHAGETIAAAMAAAGIGTFRHTACRHQPRGLYCGMGLCHECLVTVNGEPNVKACVTAAHPNRRVQRQQGLGRFDTSRTDVTPAALVHEQVQVAVVGGGPAGLAAAIAAARAGAHVLVIDENAEPGGQIYRQLPRQFQVSDPAPLGQDHADGQSLLQEVASLSDRIEIWCDALVWSFFDEQLAVIRGHELVLIDAATTVVATGAYDRPVPLPGWTLPGVMTAGGAQALLKAQRVLPGRRVLLAGTGPMQLVVANQLLDAGAEVVAVADAAGHMGLLRQAPALIRQLGLLKQGLNYLRRLRRAGVPVLRSHVLQAVRGEGHVQEAVLAEADDQWYPRPGRSKTFNVDTVCMGYGFVPHVWMTGLLGCKHRYDPRLGGWVPQFDDRMQTDLPAVFVAGDGAGVAGVLVAVEEGRLAGLFAAAELGLLSHDQAERTARPIRRRLEDLRKFRRALDQVSLIRPGLYSCIPDETVVCRCEEVTAGEVRTAVQDGTAALNDIKKRTRAGMGYCQGACCGPAIAAMLAREFGVAVEALGPMTPRPPAKPVPLSLLLVDPDTGY